MSHKLLASVPHWQSGWYFNRPNGTAHPPPHPVRPPSCSTPILSLFHPCTPSSLPVTQTDSATRFSGNPSNDNESKSVRPLEQQPQEERNIPLPCLMTSLPAERKLISSQHELAWPHYRQRVRVIKGPNGNKVVWKKKSKSHEQGKLYQGDRRWGGMGSKYDENTSVEKNIDMQMFELMIRHVREPRTQLHLMTEA